MNTELLKKNIQKALNERVEKFQSREDIICTFDKPIVAYVNPDDVLFDALFSRKLNKHPKEIYRPGKCIIMHYTPFSEEFVKENGMGPVPTDKWKRAYIESLWLAMELNQVITDKLKWQGRIFSRLNTMVEWDFENCKEEWSHKLAAAIGGLGKLGPAGSLIVNGRFGGRASGIITDGLYAEPVDVPDEAEVKKRLEKLLAPALYDGPCSREMIEACPGNAISEKGIDKCKCQEYCRTLDKEIPMPEVCGRCFRFAR